MSAAPGRYVAALFVAGATAIAGARTQAPAQLREPPPPPPASAPQQAQDPDPAQVPELPLELVPVPAPPEEPEFNARVPGAQELAGIRVGPELERLVAELDHADFARREAAMRDLCDTSEVDQLQIYAVLARKNLSAEQRHRLMTVVRRRLLDRPRGAVGINMNFEPALPGNAGPPLAPGIPGIGAVVVSSVVRGMPADGLLRRGDRITQVDGEPLFTNNDLIRRVQGKLPGETVELVVQRTVPIVVPPERPAQIAPKVPGNAREAPREGGQEAAPPGSTRWETLRITLVLASTDDLERASGTPQIQMGPVLDDRQKEVALVAEAYGPPVRVIPLKRAPGETRQ